MSLLTICQAALRGISGFATPTSFFSSTDLTAELCVALANESGQDLEKEVRWQQLVTEYTFETSPATATYVLPTGFRAFANMSMWDRTNMWRMTGPTSSVVYQWLKSGISVASTTNKFFMVRGNVLTIYPTPVGVETIAYDYYSKLWITKQSDSTNVAAWTADADTARLDEDLIAADLKWRFLQAKGMPFETEYLRYETIKDLLMADSGGRGIIDLNGPSFSAGRLGNLPDSGYGL